MSSLPQTFSQKVVALALTIPPGRVTTYGLLAVAAGGHPMLSRMITHILGKSLEVDRIPFHRIVYADGHVWLDPKYDQIRRQLYQQEGIKLDAKNKIINFDKIIYTFDD